MVGVTVAGVGAMEEVGGTEGEETGAGRHLPGADPPPRTATGGRRPLQAGAGPLAMAGEPCAGRLTACTCQ